MRQKRLLLIIVLSICMIGCAGCQILRKPARPGQAAEIAAAEKRLDELVLLPKYETIAVDRDPFLALVEGLRQGRGRLVETVRQKPLLAGIMTTGQTYRCVVKFLDKTHYLKQGDAFEQFTVDRIDPEGYVTLKQNGETMIIRLGGKEK